MENVCLKIIDSSKQINKSAITHTLVSEEGFTVIDVDRKTSELLKAGKYSVVIVTREFEDNFENAYVEIVEFLKKKGVEAQCKIVCTEDPRQKLLDDLRKEYQIDKIIKPGEWNNKSISLRIMAALYGGVGVDSIENLNRPQFRENADLYLPCAIKFEGSTKKLNFIGAVKKMREIFSAVKKRHSLLNHTILITGETGTGKELMASVIHTPKGDKKLMEKFIDVNIAEFSPSLVENELFGNVKGSFTNAQGSIGIFQAGEDETVFLDEIGELALTLQVKLLRIINNRQFKKIGSPKKYLPFKGRLICATNRNLKDMIANETFREDFYYRISDEEVEMPQLKKRKGDLELLAKEFFQLWKEDVEEDNKRIKAKNSEAETYEIKLKLDQSAFDKIVDAVISHNFPGNVRRYRTDLIKFFKSANTNTFSEAIDDLKKAMADETKEFSKNTNDEEIGILRMPNYDADFWHGTYEEIENRFKEKIAARFNEVYEEVGNVTTTCERLGIARNTYYYFKRKEWKKKLKKLTL